MRSDSALKAGIRFRPVGVITSTVARQSDAGRGPVGQHKPPKIQAT
ncbi:hypothetical protein [Photorhabdus akhurstii]|nr:hypothetical protein [Photorhabdus akhurstii]